MTTVLVLYLIALVIIAVKSARNVKGIPDFFVARKGASTKAVAGSLVASILGGSAIIGAIDAGPRMGGAAAWFMLVGATGLLALLPLTKKAYALGKYSLPDLIGKMHGSIPRNVASVVIPLAWTGIIATQIIAAAKLMQSFTSLDYATSAVAMAAVFIFYTMAGGQYSILRTDFLQALLIVIGLVTLVFFAANSGQASAAETATAVSAKAFPFNENFSPFDLFLLLLTYGTTFTAGPDMYSRIFCAKDARTAQKSILIAALVLIPAAAMIGYLAAFGATIENAGGTRIMSITQFAVPSPLMPLIAIALLSVVLSSADTLLLNSSIIIDQLITDFRQKKNIHNESKSHSLLRARIIIFANGIASLLIALHFTDIISTLLIALAIYAGAFTVPILWGLAGFRANQKFVATAIIVGGLLATFGKFAPMLPFGVGAHTGDILTISAFIASAVILACGRIRPIL